MVGKINRLSGRRAGYAATAAGSALAACILALVQSNVNFSVVLLIFLFCLSAGPALRPDPAEDPASGEGNQRDHRGHDASRERE